MTTVYGLWIVWEFLNQSSHRQRLTFSLPLILHGWQWRRDTGGRATLEYAQNQCSLYAKRS